MISIDCFGMNGGNYLPSLSIHSQSHCLPSPSRISPRSPVSTSGSESGERYSRKVFVGGLPPDIDEGIKCWQRDATRREFWVSLMKLILMLTLSFFKNSVEEINASFRRFGSLVVDWPHKAESKSYFPPKGYAFLLFQVSFSLSLLFAHLTANGLAFFVRRKRTLSSSWSNLVCKKKINCICAFRRRQSR